MPLLNRLCIFQMTLLLSRLSLLSSCVALLLLVPSHRYYAVLLPICNSHSTQRPIFHLSSLPAVLTRRRLSLLLHFYLLLAFHSVSSHSLPSYFPHPLSHSVQKPQRHFVPFPLAQQAPHYPHFQQCLLLLNSPLSFQRHHF